LFESASNGSNGFVPADEAGVASWVDAAEADHIEVHQAVGMVMVQLGIEPEQALDRLRAHAFSQGRTVTEVAQEILARTLRFGPETDDDHPEGRRRGRGRGRGRGRLRDEGDGDRS
jgi:hypothetical protein